LKIEARNIVKKFGEQTILKGVSTTIASSEIVSIVGKSGSGKSTLLYAISGLDQISSGEVLYNDQQITAFTTHEMHDFRNKNMGFVFQFHYLLPEFTVLENVLMPALKSGMNLKIEQHAMDLLSIVGLKGKESQMAKSLSGGEQQRVAIARSLVMKPQVLFADEPTGNLDSINADIVFKLFFKINQEFGTTIIYVTHDQDYADLAMRKIELVDGLIK
jgi:ABC-type lipoprotein export system ATPase subunit